MRVKIVTLTFDERLAGFPEEPLRRAVTGAEVLEVSEHFYEYAGVPRLTLVLRLGEEAGRGIRRPGGPDPYQTLPDDRKGLYVELRKWRNERAEADGVPPFVILRNELIAEICRRVPRTVAAMREISGIGEKTCARYGTQIVGLMPEGLKPLASADGGGE
ncbi:MAG: HRDC domain-containing protein [Planctomycetes bacterium]|jgi:superfamily II DNA helicase RecQ|nr:HRDC domain-containing protein [Planctomycetota bacterium]